MDEKDWNEAIVNDLKRAFRAIDKDNNGFISLKELGTIMRAFGFELSSIELKELMKEYDKDDSDCLDLQEFIDLMLKKIKEQIQEQEYFEMFELFDRNADGKLSKKELKTLFESIGEEIDDKSLEEFINYTDSDCDGYINFPEFLKFMKEN